MPFCLSCGSALDEYNFCAHCEAFADTVCDMTSLNEIGPCPRCGEQAQLRTSDEPSLADESRNPVFMVLHVTKTDACPDYEEPAAQ